MTLEIINIMIKKMNEIRELAKLVMKSTRDKTKYYADNKRILCEFEMDDKVFLKVASNGDRLKLGKSRKLLLRFCGSFEILNKI